MITPGGGFQGGISTAEDIVGAKIASVEARVNAFAAQQLGDTQSVSGIIKPEPAASFWIAYRVVKNDVIVTLKCAIDPNATELTLRLEEYEGSGVLTVVDRKNATVEITPEMIVTAAGISTIEFEFPLKLEPNTNYGVLRMVAKYGKWIEIANPAAPPPARAVRTIGDYITTFNSTNGQPIARQDASQFNLIYNGSIENATTPGGTTLDDWDRRDGAWASTLITTTNTDPVFWDKANNRLAWQDKDHGPAIGLGRRLHRSEQISPSLDVWASSAFAFDLSIDVVVQTSGVTSTVTTFNVSLNVATAVQRLNLLLEMLATYDTTVKHRLKFSTTTPLNNDGGGGTGKIVYISFVMVPRGPFPAPFSYRVETFELSGGKVITDVGAVEDPDATVTRTVPSNDTGLGIFVEGDGGFYLPQ